MAFTIVSQTRLGDRSSNGPAVAVGNGAVVMAYTGTDSRHKVNVTSSIDGMSFQPAFQPANDTSPHAPAIAFFNGKFYIAFTGFDNQIYIASGSGTDFSTRAASPAMGALSGPALAVADGKLFLAWLGTDGPSRLHVARSTDGNFFEIPTTINAALTGSPALLGLGSLIALAFTRTDGVVSLSVASTFAAQGEIQLGFGPTSATSSSGPALAFDGTNVQLASRGPGQSEEATLSDYQLSNPTLVMRHPQTPINNTATGNPAIAAFNGRLFYYWTGTNSDQNINVMQIIP